MTALVATVVDWGALGQTALFALVAGVGVTFAYSLAIVGAARFEELRRDERSLAAGAAAALLAVGVAVSVAAVVVGIVLMASS